MRGAKRDRKCRSGREWRSSDTNRRHESFAGGRPRAPVACLVPIEAGMAIALWMGSMFASWKMKKRLVCCLSRFFVFVLILFFTSSRHLNRLWGFDPKPLTSGNNPVPQNDRQSKGDVEVFTKSNWCGSVACLEFSPARWSNGTPILFYVKKFLKALLRIVSLFLACLYARMPPTPTPLNKW
jgi:hypothetical protein